MIYVFSGFLLAAESEGGLWKNIYNTYIADGGIFNSGEKAGISLPLIIIGLFFGLILAAIFSVIGKHLNGMFVHKLISDGCLSEESGKTLPELDYADKLFIRYAVKRGVSLRRVVRCREEEKYNAECAEKLAAYEEKRKENPKLPKKLKIPTFKIDPDNHHFYIPEDLRITAEIKFDQKGISLPRTLLSVILLVVAFLLVFMFLPSILSTVIGIFSSK